MSEETPNNPEERLQRYAKERRAQGGDFAMHPATRQMLQGEVARTFGAKQAAAKSRGWFAWLNSWNGRLAIGATAAVVIAGSWVIWNQRLDRHALQLAKADLTLEQTQPAAMKVARGVNAGSKSELVELGMVDALASRAELEKKAAPATPPVTVLAAAPTQRSDSDSRKTAADKLAVADAIAKKGGALTLQAQGMATSFFGSEATLSLAPVAANYSIANAPADAQKPDQQRSQQAFNYANAAGQSFTPAGPAPGHSTDAYKNQAGQALGGALTYANNDQKQLMESDVRSKAQAGSQLAMQDNALNVAESRARFSRAAAPAAPVPTTAPAPVTPARSQESQSRNTELLRSSFAASGAVAPPAQDAASTRFYRANTDATEPGRSKALSSTDRLLGESSPVLKEFVIEQKGATVRVVDGDGSVYDGTVETPPSAGFVPGKDAGGGPVREVIPGDKTETAPRHQELSFRATGSNVTLRQTVVVNARFSPSIESARGGRAMPAEAPSKVQNLAARRGAPATSNAFTGQYGAVTNSAPTIEGTVRIGTTNQQWFRALRRGP